MDTTIRQALAKTSTPPQDNTTKEIISTITAFIEGYGIYLKCGTCVKFSISTFPNKNGGCNFKLQPPSKEYGNFEATYDGNCNINHVGLANLLRNSGANIFYDEDSSDGNASLHQYRVEFYVT